MSVTLTTAGVNRREPPFLEHARHRGDSTAGFECAR